MIIDLADPWEGRRHDCVMLRESGQLERLQEISDRYGTTHVYGDPAYPVYNILQVSCKVASLSDEKIAFNRRMSKVRVSVE
jgi:DDE superfamily endonuclease